MRFPDAQCYQVGKVGWVFQGAGTSRLEVRSDQGTEPARKGLGWGLDWRVEPLSKGLTYLARDILTWDFIPGAEAPTRRGPTNR